MDPSLDQDFIFRQHVSRVIREYHVCLMYALKEPSPHPAYYPRLCDWSCRWYGWSLEDFASRRAMVRPSYLTPQDFRPLKIPFLLSTFVLSLRIVVMRPKSYLLTSQFCRVRRVTSLTRLNFRLFFLDRLGLRTDI